MGRSSLNGFYISDQDKNGEKYLTIDVSGREKKKIKIFEQIDKININDFQNKNEIEIDYCILYPYNGMSECATLFDIDDSKYASQLDNYVLTNEGSICKSLKFRPGSILLGWDEWLTDWYYEGRKCKIIYRGPEIKENDLKECCQGKRKDLKTCHPTISNNFKTSHCDFTMKNFCFENPSDKICIKWLEETVERKDEIGLSLYSNLCSLNHDKEYCSYMCMLSRKDRDSKSKYCDDALLKWCIENTENSLCNCVLTPESIISEYEEMLGPKECWLAQCTSKVLDQKWLTTEQLNIRKNCKILSCIIDIQSLNAQGNSKINLINNCLIGGSESSEAFSDFLDLKSVKNIQTWGSLFSPWIFLSIISFLILFVVHIFKIKKNKTI